MHKKNLALLGLIGLVAAGCTSAKMASTAQIQPPASTVTSTATPTPVARLGEPTPTPTPAVVQKPAAKVAVATPIAQPTATPDPLPTPTPLPVGSNQPVLPPSNYVAPSATPTPIQTAAEPTPTPEQVESLYDGTISCTLSNGNRDTGIVGVVTTVNCNDSYQDLDAILTAVEVNPYSNSDQFAAAGYVACGVSPMHIGQGWSNPRGTEQISCPTPSTPLTYTYSLYTSDGVQVYDPVTLYFQ